jgi:hypothetical protein
LTNQQAGAAFSAITNTIRDSYLGVTSEDYVTVYSNRIKASEATADQVTDDVWAAVAKNKKEKFKIDFNTFTGSYTDNWFGDIILSEKKGKLYFTSKRSPQLSGEVFFYKENNFVVKWNNAYFHADAHLFFECDATGKAIGLKMQPISELTDFSYDFQDLDFKRTEK